MPEYTSPRVEEFWNRNHSPKTGQFASGNKRYKSGPGKGLFSMSKTSRRGPKRSFLGFKKNARQGFSTPHLEEFYNHVHDGATGRFSGRAASGREGFREGSHGPGKVATTGVSRSGGLPQVATVSRFGKASFKDRTTSVATPYNFPRGDKRKGAVHSVEKIGAVKKGATKNSTAYVHTAGNITPKNGPRDGRTVTYSRSKDGKVKFGGPKTEAKLPLRNATTGRLNPSAVRAAFKQGTDEIIGKKQDSKRTTITRKSESIESRRGKFDKMSKIDQDKLVNDILFRNNPNDAAYKRNVSTSATYKGRAVKHVSSTGGAVGAARKGREDAAQALAKAWYASRVAARGK